MAIKVISGFMIAYVALFGFLMYQKPFSGKETPKAQNIAHTQINSVKNYIIKKDKIETIAHASQVRRYSDRDEFDGVDIYRTTAEKKENIKSKKATYKDDNITLIGDVRYTDDGNITITSQLVKYSIKSKIAISDGAFTVASADRIIDGDSLIYHTNEGKISAKNIRSKQRETR